MKCFLFAFLLSFLWMSCTPLCLAQSSDDSKKTSIEDYLKSNEPAQNNLVPLEEEVDPKDSMLSRLQGLIEEKLEDPEGGNNGSDVLPEMKSQTKMKISGFDNASVKNINVELDHDVELSQEELEEEIRREAFDAAITGLFPMQPDQIKKLLTEYDTTKRIVNEPVRGIPTPLVNVATVSLDPGVPPLIMTTATGHVTTLNLLDITGAPWPIQDVSWAGNFEVIEPEDGGHVLRITPLGQAAYGNMSIRLLTLKTPITIMLRTSIDEVQYRVDARVPEYGPFAQAPLIAGGAERVAGNALIISILDGTPPAGAARLDVSGVDGRTSAYNVNGMTYVRTPLTLLSPGWEQSVSSADGLNVYALDQTPVLLLSDKGRFMRASLNTAKDLLDE